MEERLGSLGNRLQARLGGRLLLFRRIAGAAGSPPRLIVVVDGDTAACLPVVEEVIRGDFGTPSAPAQGAGCPDIHLFDRTGYEGLRSLAGDALGLNDTAREVFRSPALPFPGNQATDPQKRAAKEAREKLSKAGERMRLARLMADGGFAGEAVPSLKQALDAVLESLFGLEGPAVPAGERTSMLEIERRLVKPGILPADEATRIPWMLSLAENHVNGGEAPIDRSLFDRMAAVPARLIESAELFLTSRAL